ncbi:MAG: DUF3795 domain-containing protein [Desulfobacterales bacterium]|nr:DUF3795 domain-containing protein [Desulfobacterales bacterium]
MEYKEILKDIAPCGLSCGKCFAFSEGGIRKHATELKSLLGNFDNYAERFSGFLPIFKKYPEFKEMLEYMTQADCIGCRNGECKYPNCGVTACYKDKGVDFCFQCDEFPCDKSNFDPDLHRRWIQMNNRMKEIGVESYYEETKDKCRYV